MSKSRRTSYRNAAKSTTHAAAPAAGGSPRRRAPGRQRINLEPARAALHDLAAWALELAERDVADWPEGRRRVRSARRCALAMLRGKRAPRVSVEDALFTVGLLARIGEVEFGLPMNELFAILDMFGISTQNVPISAPPSSAARQSRTPSTATTRRMAPVTPLPSRRGRCPHLDLRFHVAA